MLISMGTTFPSEMCDLNENCKPSKKDDFTVGYGYVKEFHHFVEEVCKCIVPRKKIFMAWHGSWCEEKIYFYVVIEIQMIYLMNTQIDLPTEDCKSL